MLDVEFQLRKMNWLHSCHGRHFFATFIVVCLALACNGEEEALSLFVRRVEVGQSATAKVSYLTTFSVKGGGTLEAVITVAQRPPDRRIDFDMMNDEGASAPDIFLSHGRESFACNSSKQLCYPSVEEDEEYLLADFVEETLAFRDAVAGEGADSWSVLAADSRVIAGAGADCFVATSIELNEPWEGSFCFSAEGILLALSFTSDLVEASMEALELTKELPREHFELPYPVVEMGRE